ncbi:MAG: hypothetical protein ACXVDJ_02700, partial [Tumebacillaceae bacterium]
VLVGCSQQTQKPQDMSQKPPVTDNNGQQPGPSDSSTPNEGNSNVQPTDKTEEQIQAEIKTKLGRMTSAKTGYVLPTDSQGLVEGATTIADVSELLRKKGFSIELATSLAKEFYKVQPASGSTPAGVMVIARDGRIGTFDPNEEATFTKKNKWIWIVEQKHPNDQLNGPHVATYEVEALKDGTYRLNSWTTKNS